MESKKEIYIHDLLRRGKFRGLTVTLTLTMLYGDVELINHLYRLHSVCEYGLITSFAQDNRNFFGNNYQCSSISRAAEAMHLLKFDMAWSYIYYKSKKTYPSLEILKFALDTEKILKQKMCSRCVNLFNRFF